MIAKGAVVLVMVDNAEHERHAQVQQTHQANHYAGFRHAGLEFGVSHCECQEWFGIPCLLGVMKRIDYLLSGASRMKRIIPVASNTTKAVTRITSPRSAFTWPSSMQRLTM